MYETDRPQQKQSPFLQHIELRHLRYFVAAAEQGSFRKAAAEIGIKESGISRRIRDLEEHLGVLLFQRHNGGVCLTIAGHRFLQMARKIAREIGEGATEVSSVGNGESGRIRVGVASCLSANFTTELLRAYDRHHDGVLTEFVEGVSQKLVAAVHRSDLDLAIVSGNEGWPDCEMLRLWTEHIFVALPEDHKLVVQEEIEWCDLVSERFIVGDASSTPEVWQNVSRKLSALGHSPKLSAHEIGKGNLLALVALRRGLTLVNEATTAIRFPGIAFRPIKGEATDFVAVWSARNDNPALSHLLRLAKPLARATSLSN